MNDGTTIDQILNNPVEFTKRDVDHFFETAQNLITAFENSAGEKRVRIGEDMTQFLDIVRDVSLQSKVYEANRQEEWFRLLLEIIDRTDFTVGDLLRQRIRRYANRALFKTVNGKKVEDISWNEIYRRVVKTARALFSFSRNEDVPGPVAILSENSLNMVVVDLACLSTGVVDVLIPANSMSSNIEFMLNQSQAEVLFVSSDAQLNKIAPIKSKLTSLKQIIKLEPGGTSSALEVTEFTDLLSRAQKVSKTRIEQAMNRVGIHDLATIMYTSGTTEAPKGIQFTQRNLISKRFARALALPEIGDSDVFICYLPLYHTFGRYFEMLGCIFWGSTYVFMESTNVDTMISNMKLVKPTVFISIPKKWSELYERIQEKVDIETAAKSKLKTVVASVTGGKLRWGLSAAGYLDPDVFRFFQSMDIELMSGFGMTEATGGITMTPPFEYRAKSVGKALPGIEIRLAEDGEMLIRGPYVTPGYLESDGSEFDEDGWLFTGDIFNQERDGFLQIVDRKKEIYKNIRGETIAPQKIENLFYDFESVKQVFLVGDHRAYNTLLLYPNYDYEQTNLNKMTHEELRQFFSSLMVSVNRFLAPFERIVNFAIIERPISEQHGELTPKGTYKRKIIEEHFQDTIERMYRINYLTHHIGDIEIRIPNRFLRIKGLTADDLRFTKNKIVLHPTGAELALKPRKHKSTRLQVGDFEYELREHRFDLNDLIYYPSLWVGNSEFENFVGEELFSWSAKLERDQPAIALIAPAHTFQHRPTRFREVQTAATENRADLKTLHLAAYCIHTANERAAHTAVRYLDAILQNSKDEQWRPLIKSILMRLADSKIKSVKKFAFEVLIKNDAGAELNLVFERFVFSKKSALDQEAITRLAEGKLSRIQLKSIFEFLTNFTNSERWKNQALARRTVNSVLNLLTAYSIRHPISYKLVRTELVKWITLYQFDQQVSNVAKRCYKKLLSGFRDWLGRNQKIAVDPETFEEYGWEDVITFESNIEPEDRELLASAIINAPIIQEATFLFSKGTTIRLPDIAHKGVWVSFLGSRHGKSVFRAAVHTRHSGSFDIALNLHRSLSDEDVHDEINWLICAGSTDDLKPLVEDFGGYWPAYRLWSEEFIPGETVEKLLKRLERRTKTEDDERLQLIWPNFAWSGISAYVDFWNRTGRRLEIADPTPVNVIVPAYDYQVGFRIVSISSRKPFKSVPDMMLSLRKHFIESVESNYSSLAGVCSWHVIFSSFLEILGEDEGLRLLEQTSDKLQNRDSNSRYAEMSGKLDKFVKSVRQKGYLPKRLYFAVQRFERWLRLNPQATTQARMQTLQDLHTTYRLDQLEKEYPGTRIQYFRDTIFADTRPEIEKALNTIIRNIKQNGMTEQSLHEEISQLSGQVEFTEEEKFFLTRMSYPHLGPQDSAELVSLELHGSEKAALVVYIEDMEGERFAVRQPATPKEIARLHRLFTSANLPIDFQPEHHYLVVLNERAHVIGGLFYRYVNQHHVHMEKIVVDERFRRKGISEGLLKEFFKRLRSEEVKIVTVGFLRPEFFYRFGFNIDHQFGNMVKKLDEPEPEEISDELLEEI